MKDSQAESKRCRKNHPRRAQEEDPTKAPSESGLSLTSTRLKIHQETQNARAALKEGQLSEEEFWNKISKSDKQPLWKKFENERNKNEEAKASWEALKGKGVVSKKKQLLLHFLKTGRTQEGGLKQS